MRNRATFIASLLLAACSDDAPPPAKTTDYQVDFQAATTDRGKVDPGATFVDVTAAAGIDFVHVNGAMGEKWLPETMGAGVGVFDYDGDGRLDLLFVQSGHWLSSRRPPSMKLYRNLGKWRFEDVTKQVGLDVPCYGMGVAIADYDADGDPDVYITALDENHLFRNEGGVRFQSLPDAPRGGHWMDGKEKRASWSTGAAWFDADGDGDLDLLVVSYVRWTRGRDVHAEVVEGIKSYTRPQLYEGDSPRLYLQNDDHSFTDATAESGFGSAKVAGKSMAICLDDFNGDGKLDVFIANDTVQNFLFLNRGGGAYEEVAVSASVAYDDNGQARAGMGTDSGRITDGISVAVGNFSEEPVSLYTVANTKELIFRDDAATARIGHPTLLPLTFGLLIRDLDLDGWPDLVLANGHIEPSMPQLKAELQYAQAPQYFRNLGGKRMADVSLDAGAPFSHRIVGRGLAAGDLDGDGDLDLVFTSNGGRAMVLRNDVKGKPRVFRFRAHRPGTKNPDAIGAVVEVTAGGHTQRQVVRTGSSYLSQSEMTLTFGLGDAEEFEATVTWPDGTREKIEPKR